MIERFEAMCAGWDQALVELHPHFAGVSTLDALQLALVCWIGGHLMTRGQLLPMWLRGRRHKDGG